MVNAGSVVKELQDMRDEGYLSDALLRHAVRNIHSADDRYDWVGVYLLRDSGDQLWLHNYVGAGTEHAEIPVGEGVCGMAIAEGTNQNVPDVSAVSYYIACDPATKSELVILIRAGGQIFGQIDIDSKQASAFTEDDEAAVIEIADKLAEQIAHERR